MIETEADCTVVAEEEAGGEVAEVDVEGKMGRHSPISEPAPAEVRIMMPSHVDPVGQVDEEVPG